MKYSNQLSSAITSLALIAGAATSGCSENNRSLAGHTINTTSDDQASNNNILTPEEDTCETRIDGMTTMTRIDFFQTLNKSLFTGNGTPCPPDKTFPLYGLSSLPDGYIDAAESVNPKACQIVQNAINHGLLPNPTVEDEELSPNRNINRVEAAQYLFRLLQAENPELVDPTATSPFNNTPIWATEAIANLNNFRTFANDGLSTTTEFCADHPLTQESFAVWLETAGDLIYGADLTQYTIDEACRKIQAQPPSRPTTEIFVGLTEFLDQPQRFHTNRLIIQQAGEPNRISHFVCSNLEDTLSSPTWHWDQNITECRLNGSSSTITCTGLEPGISELTASLKLRISNNEERVITSNPFTIAVQ